MRQHGRLTNEDDDKGHGFVSRSAPVSSVLVFSGLFFAALAGAAAFGLVPWLLLGAYGAVSALLFIAYGADKNAAVHGRRRTQEATLHLLALFGGWPGALIAQRVFRHKTIKQPFRAIFWSTVAANCAVLIWVMAAAVAGPR
jgi:uncharacterized membrane protein YsdA (DUF1294 family)